MPKMTNKKKSEIYHEIGHVALMLGENIEKYLHEDAVSIGDKKIAKLCAGAMSAMYKVYNDATSKSVDMEGK